MTEYLMSKKRMDEVLKMLGPDKFREEFIYKKRQSGETTKDALRTILFIMEDEGKWVGVDDIEIMNMITYILSNLPRV